MKKIDCIIIGAGGHAAEIVDYIQAINKEGLVQIKIYGFLDDNAKAYQHYEYEAPLLESIKQHQINNDVYYLMGIANIQYRKNLIEQFINAGAKFYTIIHPRALVSKTAIIGEGSVLAPYVNVGPKAVVAPFNLLNSRCSIGHDSILGKYNFISPNVAISGFTEIGENNLMGVNSATIPGIKIGNDNKIAAGMVVDKNVHNNEIVFYRYKEKIIAVTQGK